MKPQATLAHIGALIKAKRREHDIGLRAAAEESGVSASTLSRLERGVITSLPDAETLTKLANWLNIPFASLLAQQGSKRDDQGPELSTPEVIEVHLRADKQLSPKTADTLAKMFHLLYDQFANIEKGEAAKGQKPKTSRP